MQPLKWRVSDGLWARLEPLLVDPPRRFRSPGRRRYSPRQCLEGILYVLFTDTPWLEVPYRELGLPCGSGQVEAQCKSLVGARCKQAGMRNWTYAGAEAVLRLRAAVQDGSYAQLWERRLQPAA